jgi:NifU-like protein involved in Fe-S cluster formation
MDNLYTKEIIRLAASLNAERLTGADLSIYKKSRICGSAVTIDLSIKDGVVTGFGAEVKACALGQATTAIVEANIIGQRLDDIPHVKAQLENLLAGEAVTFPSPWEKLSVFERAEKYKARHSAILLPFLALEEAKCKYVKV